MSDDHSEVVPLLPIPNRTVKRLCADDSAGSRVKVGHRQTLTASKRPSRRNLGGAFVFLESECGGEIANTSNPLSPLYRIFIARFLPSIDLLSIAGHRFQGLCRTCQLSKKIPDIR